MKNFVKFLTVFLLVSSEAALSSAGESLFNRGFLQYRKSIEVHNDISKIWLQKLTTIPEMLNIIGNIRKNLDPIYEIPSEISTDLLGSVKESQDSMSKFIKTGSELLQTARAELRKIFNKPISDISEYAPIVIRTNEKLTFANYLRFAQWGIGMMEDNLKKLRSAIVVGRDFLCRCLNRLQDNNELCDAVSICGGNFEELDVIAKEFCKPFKRFMEQTRSERKILNERSFYACSPSLQNLRDFDNE